MALCHIGGIGAIGVSSDCLQQMGPMVPMALAFRQRRPGRFFKASAALISAPITLKLAEDIGHRGDRWHRRVGHSGCMSVGSQPLQHRGHRGYPNKSRWVLTQITRPYVFLSAYVAAPHFPGGRCRVSMKPPVRVPASFSSWAASSWRPRPCGSSTLFTSLWRPRTATGRS